MVAIAGYNNDQGQLQIAAVATRQTKGLKAGRVENIALVTEALSGVIAELETTLGVSIQQAYGGISGEYVRCERYGDEVPVLEPSNGVSAADVGALHAIMRRVVAPDADIIMEYTPQNYVVDDKGEEQNPIGTFGHKLSSTFNFILSEKEALKRLDLAFKQSGIALKECFANSLASAEAVLSSDEMEAGVAVVDLGEGMTNVAIYRRNALRHLASIPIGGGALNIDISSLMIHKESVEALKCSCGVAIAENAPQESIDVVGRTSRDSRSVPIYNIAVAIQERMTDIIIFVNREIRDSGYIGRLPYGIVLTGGGAKLREVDELFRRNLGLDVRVANPEEGMSDESLSIVASPEYATVVGLLKRGIQMDQRGIGESCIADEQVADEQVVEAEEQTTTDDSVEQSAETIEQEVQEVQQTQEEQVKVEEPEKQAPEPVAEKPKEPEPVVVEPPKIEPKKVVKESKDSGVESEPKSNPLMKFMKSLADKVNDILTSPDDDQEF